MPKWPWRQYCRGQFCSKCQSHKGMLYVDHADTAKCLVIALENSFLILCLLTHFTDFFCQLLYQFILQPTITFKNWFGTFRRFTVTLNIGDPLTSLQRWPPLLLFGASNLLPLSLPQSPWFLRFFNALRG